MADTFTFRSRLSPYTFTSRNNPATTMVTELGAERTPGTGGDPTAAIAAHNASGTAHPDIRALIDDVGVAATLDSVLALGPSWYVNASYTAVAPGKARGLFDRAATGDAAAATELGMAVLPDLSGGGRPATNVSAAAPVAPGYWEDDALLGQWEVPAPTAWPVAELDFTWTGFMLPTGRDATASWNEMLLSTIDQIDDWLEPGFVQLADGIHVGLDYWVDGEGESTWQTTGTVDVSDELTVRITVDATAGELNVYVDGELFETATLPEAPFEFGRGTVGDPVYVGRNALVTRHCSLSDEIGGDPILEISADDQTGWTGAGGIVSDGFDAPRLIRGAGLGDSQWAAETVDIAADADMTLALYGRFWDGAQGPFLGANPTGVMSGQAGFLLVSYEAFSIPFGFAIGSGGAPATAVASATPEGDGLLVIELDRSESELRVSFNGDVIATGDASGVGAVVISEPFQFLLGYSDVEWIAQFDRLLTTDEKAALAGADFSGLLVSVQGRTGPHVDLSDLFLPRSTVVPSSVDDLGFDVATSIEQAVQAVTSNPYNVPDPYDDDLSGYLLFLALRDQIGSATDAALGVAILEVRQTTPFQTLVSGVETDRLLGVNDLGYVIPFSTDADCNLVIPSADDLTLPLGATVHIWSAHGSSLVTVIGDPSPTLGVTPVIRTRAGTTTTLGDRYSFATLRQTGILNEWLLEGDLAPEAVADPIEAVVSRKGPRPNGQSGRDWVIPGVTLSTTSVGVMNSNRQFFELWNLDREMTFDAWMIETTIAGAAGNTFRWALYAADEFWQPTGPLLFQSAAVATDVAAGAIQTAFPGSGLTLPAGRYVCSPVQNGSATYRLLNAIPAWGSAGLSGTAGASPFRTLGEISGVTYLTTGFPDPANMLWTGNVATVPSLRHLVRLREVV